MNDETPQQSPGPGDALVRPRMLGDVLDEILQIAPDLQMTLGSLRQSVRYAAPEIHGYWWRQTAAALNQHAADHPQREKIARLFAGA